MSTPKSTNRWHVWEPWIRFFLAVLLTTAVYLPLSLVPTVATPRTFLSSDASVDIGVVALPPDSELPVQAQFAHQLYHWVEVNNPSLLIWPSKTLGFSHYLLSMPPRTTSALEQITWESQPQEKPEWQPIALTVYAPTAAQSLAEDWPQETNLMLPTVPPKSPKIGVFWRDHRGRILQNPPECPEEDWRRALAAGLPTGITVVEVQANPLLPIFRIVIRQSCGNSELDSLVVQAIRGHLEAGKMPAPAADWLAGSSGRSITLEVDWRLQEIAASNNGAMP